MTKPKTTSQIFSPRVLLGGAGVAALAFTTAFFGSGSDNQQSSKKEKIFGDQLPALSAALDQTSVSGISSGAYMAGQFQLAHGELVVGAAIIAGGPYGCAESTFADVIPGPGTAFLNLSKAVNGCMLNNLKSFNIPDVTALADRARKRAEQGGISSISTVTTDKIYLFSGKSDRTVVPAIVKAARDFYTDLGVKSENILHLTDSDAGHAFVTETEGQSCSRSGPPFVVDCDYDQAGGLLQHIYGPLNARNESATGDFLRFSQRPFFKDFRDHGLAVTGIVYIPKACQSESCRIHVAFHGCAQGRQFVGGKFAEKTGFARWADTNKLLVLFPQTSASPVNPQGCWDWWGFTGNDYLTKKAPQVRAVHRMLKRLASPRD